MILFLAGVMVGIVLTLIWCSHSMYWLFDTIAQLERMNREDRR